MIPGQLGPISLGQAGLPGFILGHKSSLDFDHIVDRNAFSDGHDQLDFSFDGFEDGSGSSGWRHVYHGGVAAGLLLRFSAVLEDWHAQMGRAGLAWRSSSDDLGTVIDSSLSMVGSLVSVWYLLSSDALADHLGVPVDEDIRLRGSESSEESAGDH